MTFAFARKAVEEYLVRSNLYNNYFASLNAVGNFGAQVGGLHNAIL
jgi:hypothetical protein